MRSFFLFAFLAATMAGQSQVSLLGGDPLSTDSPPFSNQSHGLSPTGLWADSNGPLPTNAWWQNLVLGGGNLVVNSLPYLVKVDGDALRFSMPDKVVQQNFIFTSFADDLNFGATQGLPARQVTDYGPLHVRLDWGTGAGSMHANLVRGMPYVTAHYNGLTPRIGTIHAITSLNGGSASATVTSDRFEIATNSGDTWVVYASSPITLSQQGGALQASGTFTGTLRAAVLTGGGEAVLDAYADRIPVGGTVDAVATGDLGELTFNWETQGTGSLLMMALPHHMDVLANGTATSLTRNTLKGDMTGIVADSWQMDEPLTPIGWTAANPIAPAYEQSVRDALSEDVGFGVTAGDPYFGGKQFSALARLALIADELNETALANTYRNNLGNALEQRLAGQNGDPLVYDQTWGGLVAASGINNAGASFGQGYYNDHHFHYGYWIYAAAAMAKDNPAWVSQWGDEVMHLIRDIAEPSGADPNYGYMRNKDWFVGHSWAAGLFEFGDSRNQESSSEAVNAWYGVYLYGLAIGDDRLRDLGRLMLATELRATWKYWQINTGEGIYPEPYASNKVVGILWGTKVDYTTFFGANIEFIHGIQMLPFTPITEELLRAEWIEEEYPVVSTVLSNPALSDGWRGFIVMAHAVIDPNAAWSEAQALNWYDDGNTKTNTLYWLATRPGLDGDGGGGGGGGGGGDPVAGCTDIDAVNYSLTATVNDGSCLYPVTLSVDMNDPSSPDGPVYLAGTFNGWTATVDPLDDSDGDGIWTITKIWPLGEQEYKFTLFDWSDQEMFAGGESCTLTTGEFVNRIVNVNGPIVTPAVCWESCDPCVGGCPADVDNDGICDNVDPCVGALDACGVCNGPGAVFTCGCNDIPAGDCDCNGNQLDVLGVCGGGCTNDMDSDGICDDVDPCVGVLDAVGTCNGNCQSDTNGNGICDVDDIAGCAYPGASNYSALASMDDGSCVFDLSSDCPADVDADGLIAVNDVLLVLSGFGQFCE